MQPTDLARVLREYTLEPLRRELRRTDTRMLVIEDARAAAELAPSSTCFDAVWVQLDALEGVDLAALAGGVVRALRPGGRLVCVVPGAWPLGRLLGSALRARGEPPGILRARVAGRPARQVSFSSFRRAFEPSIRWRRSRALGVLVPPATVWGRLSPLTLGLLASAEDVVAGWPLARTLGDYAVHEGVRR